MILFIESNHIYLSFNSFYYVLRVFNKEDLSRYKEKILSHILILKNNNKKLIWFHAASIGELKSIFPIIENLNTHENEREFLITTSTLSSSKIADIKFKNYNNIHHRFSL